MPSVSSSGAISGAGVSITDSIVRTADNVQGFEVTLPAAKVGQLTTRTDDETGTLTMAADHGITTASVIDIYWATGARYGVLVGTVSGTSVPIGADDAGTGDVLPTNLTAVTAVIQTTINIAIDGDALAILGMKAKYASSTSSAVGRVGFYDSANDEIESVELVANASRKWDITGGDANGFAGDPITYAKASQSSATETATLQIVYAVDSTP